MFENVTWVANSSAAPLGEGKGDLAGYLVDGAMLTISLVGLVGNSTAMFILTSSDSIHKSKSYVLLMNQSLLDASTSVAFTIYLVFKYAITWHDMGGAWDSLLCYYIYSQLNCASLIYCSSYNLVVLSVERMISVAWPIWHRVYVSPRLLVWASVGVWVFGLCSMAAFSLPVNGITPRGDCYYWSRLPAHSKLYYSLAYNSFFSLVPMLAMCCCYGVIYARVRSMSRLDAGLRLNVVRTLAVCVAFFCVCHVTRASLSVAARLTRYALLNTDFYVIALILLQTNTAVNPFIYSFQYADYREELKRQLRRVCGQSSYLMECESSTVSASVQLDSIKKADSE